VFPPRGEARREREAATEEGKLEVEVLEGHVIGRQMVLCYERALWCETLLCNVTSDLACDVIIIM